MRRSLAFNALWVALMVACGESSVPGPSGSAGAGTTYGGSMSGSASIGGASSGSAGAPSESGSGGNAAGQGGALDGGSGGALGSAGNPNGAGNPGVAGSAGTGNAADCTRQLLETTVDAYFKALAAHMPASLPLAENVKFTENGKVSKLGDDGLWKTAGALKYAHSALDTELCMTASEAVVPDGATDVPIAVRLRVQNQKLTEIETIVARSGDYPAVVASPATLAASDEVVKWEQPVPLDQRAMRQELTGWMKKYFERFPAGVCSTSSDCKRMENGGGSFMCSTGASCAMGTGSGQPVLNPRLILADVETGIGVGFTIFTGGYVDMHMFKMYGGKVHVVSAILANGANSGWD
jgi:hypothetical protein